MILPDRSPAPDDDPRDSTLPDARPARPSRPRPAPVPVRADGDEVARHRAERAEAEAAVHAVMQREEVKARRLEAVERPRVRRSPRLRAALLAGLLLFNGYLWFGNPQWLTWHEPPAESIDYYQNSYKMAVYLQRQRIEEYRRGAHRLPQTASQAGPPVRGVRYEPVTEDRYLLSAGRGSRAVTFASTDSIAAFMGRTLIELGMRVGGFR